MVARSMLEFRWSGLGCAVLVAIGVAWPGARAADAVAPKMSLKLQITSTAAVIGREVRDPDDRHLGFIDYVLFDITSGAVRHVVLAPASDMNRQGDFIALSWQSLVRPLPKPGEALRTTLRRAHVMASPEFDAEQVFAATERDTVPASFAVKAADAARKLKSSGASGSRSASRRIIAGEDLESLDIADDIDRIVAAIDRVIIDTEAGRIAYLIAVPATGPMTDSSLLPVPFEGASWSAPTGNYRAQLHGGLHTVVRLEALADGLQQRSIDRALLTALFDTYGVSPYWSADKPGSTHSAH
jgi:hypothetical protein